MNQDQVKENLQKLRENINEFTVIFSGKQSKKVNGLYHPETREIIIHNKNFEDDNLLMYTAIHEFAHHIGPKKHNTEFRSLFHSLLEEAEEKGIYIDVIEKIPELKEIADYIKDLQRQQAIIVKEIGQKIMEAEKLCRKHGARFEDFIERGIKMKRPNAVSAMKAKAMDLPTEVGPDNLKILANINNYKKRNEAMEAMLDGETPDQVKQQIKAKAPEDTDTKLMREKKRIEKALTSLQKRLYEIEEILGS